MIDGALLATLRDVALLLEPTRDPWWIIGSAAVALLGVEPLEVADVDVLLSVADAERIFPACGLAALPGAPHPDFRSEVFGTWRNGGLPVELMAGFRFRQGADWQVAAPATRCTVAVADTHVFVPERAELLGLLRSLGRPKDLARARMLEMLD